MAGFISLSMPEFFEKLGYVSPLKWGSYILANVVFQGETFTCDDDVGCYLTTGQSVLQLYGMNDNDGPYGMKYHYYMLAIVTMAYFLVALVAIRLRAWKLSH